jgi:hypothetical protein
MTMMNETRLLAIIEAYGGDPGSWPESERDSALVLLETSSAGQRARDTAVALDTMLGEAAVAPATLALQTRIAVITEQSITESSDWTRIFWPFGAIWRPAAGLAAAAVIGLVVGIGAPLDDLNAAAISDTDTEAYTAIITAAGGEIEENLQ